MSAHSYQDPQPPPHMQAPATITAALWMGKQLRTAPTISAAQIQQAAWFTADRQTPSQQPFCYFYP